MVEIGFGKAGQQRNSQRLLKADGKLNVRKKGVSCLQSLSVYHAFVTMSWPQFFLTVAGTYFVSNLLFAALYCSLGLGALKGVPDQSSFSYFWHCFFFSIQTFATIGYGQIGPESFSANILVAVESLIGLLVFALITGLVFTRFAKPQVRIIFSNTALITPYKENMSLQFRLVNVRSSELMEPRVRLVFSRLMVIDGKETREYYPLKLLIDQVMFMPLYWTLTHVIDENSPLKAVTEEELTRTKGEFLIMITGTDESSGEIAYVRHSYLYDEVKFGVRYGNLYIDEPDGVPTIDVSHLSEVTPL